MTRARAALHLRPIALAVGSRAWRQMPGAQFLRPGEFQKGATVTIHGLAKKPELNGQQARAAARHQRPRGALGKTPPSAISAICRPACCERPSAILPRCVLPTAQRAGAEQRIAAQQRRRRLCAAQREAAAAQPTEPSPQHRR